MSSEARFFLELFDVVTVRPPIHTPVDIPQVIAGLVGPEFCELRRESSVWRAVQTHQEALDNLPRDELDAPQL